MSNKMINLKYEITNIESVSDAKQESFLIVVDTGSSSDTKPSTEFKMPQSLAGQYTKINAGKTVKKKED